MNNSFTPAPWTIEETGSAINIVSDFGEVAQVFGAENPDDETMPNARLLAAAPEILVAGQQMVDLVESWMSGPLQTVITWKVLPPALVAMKAAIAKAEPR